MPNRIIRLAALSAALLALTMPLSAHAQTATVAGPTVVDPNCDGLGTGALVAPTAAAYIRNLKTKAVVGSIQLCESYDGSAHLRRWGGVTLYSDIWSYQHANGRVVKTQSGWPDEISYCSDLGGSGMIVGGIHDRNCRTAPTSTNSYWYDRAEAYVYEGNTIIASGGTGKFIGSDD